MTGFQCYTVLYRKIVQKSISVVFVLLCHICERSLTRSFSFVLQRYYVNGIFKGSFKTCVRECLQINGNLCHELVN